MKGTARLLVTVSRPEFLPANSASLIIGLSWGLEFPLDLIWELLIPLVLVFTTITFVSAIAAQMNTISDYELDLTDRRKKELTKAMHGLGDSKLKPFILIEFLSSLISLLLLILLQGKPVLILWWIAGVFLAHSYSAPPLRLKSRGWLAVLTLLIVLSVLPVTFVYYVFNTEITRLFLLFLLGQALTVYSIIVPAEIRDFFRDKAMGVVTMTVQLGLVNASLLGMILLSLGGALCGIGFLLKMINGLYPIFSVSLLVMIVPYIFVLRKYKEIHLLSKRYVSSEDRDSVAEKIEQISAQNPKWITLITQTILLMSLILLVTKILT